MAAAAVSQRYTQLLGPGGILQKIHPQFQFEGQALNRSNQGLNQMAVDRDRGASISTAQEEFSYCTGLENARF